MKRSMDPLQVIGTKELDVDEQEIISRVANRHYAKIQRLLKDLSSVQVHVKTHSKGGKKRYEIKVRAMTPAHVFESSMEDWDLAKCLHVACEELQHEIMHKLAPKKKTYRK